LTRFAAVFVFLFSFSAFAQDSLAPQTISELKLLQKAALNSDYAYRQTSFLSDNIGPRPAGSAAYARATESVPNFANSGLKSRLKTFRLSPGFAERNRRILCGGPE